MSQDNTYNPGEMPPEAAMTPAMERELDAPPPAAQTLTPEEAASRVPARTSAASLRLWMLRNRMQGITSGDMQWVDAAHMPIDRPTRVAIEPPRIPQRRQNNTITNGAALTTLMRSAVRQHAPVPAPLGRMTRCSQASGQAQMRGALRQVVRNAQYPASPQ